MPPVKTLNTADMQPASSGAVQGCLSHAWPCQSAPAGLGRAQRATWSTAFSTASLKLTLWMLLAASSLQGSLAWPFRHPPPPELVGLETTWQCTELKPWQHPNRTVCEFRNALIFNGDLWVFSNTTQPLPSISRDFWLTNVILDVRQIRDPADIVYFSPELPTVMRLKSAVAQWWVFHQNYFHIMAEYLPIIHNLVCTYWGDCTYDPGSDLRLILYTDRGDVTHFLHHRDLPEAQAFEAPRCLAGPNPLASSDSPGNTSANQLVLFDRLLTGWGPQCRSDPIHCQPCDAFLTPYQTACPRDTCIAWTTFCMGCRDKRRGREGPSPEMMRSWQQRLADCTFGGFTPQKDMSSSRFTISVRDRGKEQPRHITNMPEVLRKLAQRYPDAIVEPMSPVGMNLQAQARAFNNLSAVIWVHGADMANMVFLPENATAIQIIPDMQRNPKSYVWPEELVRDLPNRVNFHSINITDPGRISFQIPRIEDIPFGEGENPFLKLNDAEKEQVYVNKTCPARLPAITGDPDWIEKCEEFFLKRNVNVQIDVEQLYPILDQAVAEFKPAAPIRQTRARHLVQRQQQAQ